LRRSGLKTTRLRLLVLCAGGEPDGQASWHKILGQKPALASLPPSEAAVAKRGWRSTRFPRKAAGVFYYRPSFGQRGGASSAGISLPPAARPTRTIARLDLQRPCRDQAPAAPKSAAAYFARNAERWGSTSALALCRRARGRGRRLTEDHRGRRAAGSPRLSAPEPGRMIEILGGPGVVHCAGDRPSRARCSPSPRVNLERARASATASCGSATCISCRSPWTLSVRRGSSSHQVLHYGRPAGPRRSPKPRGCAAARTASSSSSISPRHAPRIPA